MIERYFQKGVRLKWTMPGSDESGSKDGSIILNPPRPLCPMVYDGLDEQLLGWGTPLNMTTTLGLTKGMSIGHRWLSYCPGHTSKVMASGHDVLTGPMSGCLVVRWLGPDGWWVGHIGTIGGNPEANKKVKQAFVPGMPPNTTGFDPSAAWGPGDLAPILSRFRILPVQKILGLVTSVGDFYSILLLWLPASPMPIRPGLAERFRALLPHRKQQVGAPVSANPPSNDCCVGGIKRVPGLNRNVLLNRMIPPPRRG